jgi:alpha-tubulin suppressor-like RCC1 family protein
MALRSDHTLWAWGANHMGQLGLGHDLHLTDTSKPGLVAVPAAAAAGTTWAQVATGAWHTMALLSDGTLWGWGDDRTGCIIDGVETYQPVPISIPTPSGATPGSQWKQVSCGTYSTMALRSDGTLWGWGYNTYQQLGHAFQAGSTNPTPAMLVPTPTDAAPGTTWTRVICGAFLTMAMRSDGTLWCWGQGSGQKEDLGMKQIPTPATAAPGTIWTDFSAGNNFYAALRSDGTLWSAGTNNFGELGINNTHMYYYYQPLQQEFTNNRWTHLSAGWQFMLATDADGNIYGTGHNEHSNLGDGTTTDRYRFNRTRVLATALPRTLPALQPTPNPARDFLVLPGLTPTATLRLHDTQGRLVREGRMVAGKLDVRGLAPGLYLLSVQEPGQASRTARVVLE